MTFSGMKNTMNIPKIEEVKNVHQLVIANKGEIYKVMVDIANTHKNLKTIEENINLQNDYYSMQLQKFNEAIDSIRFLKKQKEKGEEKCSLNVQIYEGLYKNVDLSIDSVVHIQINPNLLIEFKYDEAIDFLQQSVDKFSAKLDELKQNNVFLQVQISRSQNSLQKIDKYIENVTGSFFDKFKTQSEKAK